MSSVGVYNRGPEDPHTALAAAKAEISERMLADDVLASLITERLQAKGHVLHGRTLKELACEPTYRFSTASPNRVDVGICVMDREADDPIAAGRSAATEGRTVAIGQIDYETDTIILDADLVHELEARQDTTPDDAQVDGGRLFNLWRHGFDDLIDFTMPNGVIDPFSGLVLIAGDVSS